ncbi:MAG: Coenzyme F420 hydrogenase/dehydrogenase, beta subunit C-terminal domain [Phycisphaerae bacterium]
MRLKLADIQDVSDRQLCCGCGACAHVASEAVEMVDVPDAGLRPKLRPGAERNGQLKAAMDVCPGHALAHDDHKEPDLHQNLADGWGPVLAVWEGYAGDGAVRHGGSSGGAATALSLYCIEHGGMEGALHIAAREDVPYLNETVMSRTREELLGRTGSRYAPASPCDRLGKIEAADRPCVFIGKPCDVAAAAKARRIRPALDEKLGLTIGIFCAGTPSTGGTLAMLKRMGVDDPSRLVSLRYRGNGWPGKATAEFRTDDGSIERRELTYQQSWGEVLTKHVQWRCRLCADHTGEFADVSVGDPWYKPPKDNAEPGRSLIIARTQRGRRMIEAAIAAGHLVAEPRDPEVLPASQPNLLRTRGAVWGRITTLRLMGRAAPRYRGMPMLRWWWSELTWKQKLQSVGGTVKRALRQMCMAADGSM